MVGFYHVHGRALVEVKVDRAGRMVIPARLRRALGIGEDGGVVDVEDGPDGLVIRPHDTQPARLRHEDGLLVIDVGRDVSNDEVLAAIDEERARRG